MTADAGPWTAEKAKTMCPPPSGVDINIIDGLTNLHPLTIYTDIYRHFKMILTINNANSELFLLQNHWYIIDPTRHFI